MHTTSNINETFNLGGGFRDLISKIFSFTLSDNQAEEKRALEEAQQKERDEERRRLEDEAEKARLEKEAAEAEAATKAAEEAKAQAEKENI